MHVGNIKQQLERRVVPKISPYFSLIGLMTKGLPGGKAYTRVRFDTEGIWHSWAHFMNHEFFLTL